MQKTTRHCWKKFKIIPTDGEIHQWNRIESPEIKPHTYGQLICDKGGKDIQWRKDSLFNKWCWENWTATCKRMKLEQSLTPYTKINSKCKTRHYQTLRGKHRKNTLWHNHSKIFFDPLPRGMEIKSKINKWDIMKQNLLQSKGNYKQEEKTTLRMGKNICKQINGQTINLQNI